MTESPSWTVLLDTNAYDVVVDTPGALVACRDLVTLGRLRVPSIHYIEEELAAVRDETRRELLQSVPREVVPAIGFVLGRAQLGQARLGTDEMHERLEPGRHFEDSMVGIVATEDGVQLVTADRRLANRVQTRGAEVSHPTQLVAQLLGAAADNLRTPPTC